jgi:putative transposase
MPPLALSEDDVRELQSIANSRSLPHSLVQRARIVLACDTGETNTTTPKRMGVTVMTVGKWRKRYREFGIEGLHNELRPSRPNTYEDDKVAGSDQPSAADKAQRRQHPMERPLPRR